MITFKPSIKPSIIKKLEDLHKHATTERSHFYVASCCHEAIGEIMSRDSALRRLESAIQNQGFRIMVDLTNGDIELERD